MTRWRFVAALLLCWLPVLLVEIDSAAAEPAVSAESEILLVYVSAMDCPPCRTWSSQRKPEVKAHPLRRFFTFREVAAYKVRNVGDPSVWPADLVWVRDELRIRRGAPLWIIAVDGQIVWYSRRDAARPHWANTWARLKSLAERKQALGPSS